MAGKLKMVVFMVMVAAALQLQRSEAQTPHVVGDALGWTVPPGGSIAYSTWASNKTFTVGDVLVFNFVTNVHDVAVVTKAAFDACNTNSPLSLHTTGPTNITLNSTGEHFYICTFSSHCNLGQKLSINVSNASTPPAPQPATPPAPSTPAPTPSAVSPAPTPPNTPATPPTSPATPPTSPATPPSSPGAPTPSSTATPPSSTGTPPSPSPPPPTATTPSSPPPSVTAPPPPNSAPSFAMAALPITFLSIALAFLY